MAACNTGRAILRRGAVRILVRCGSGYKRFDCRLARPGRPLAIILQDGDPASASDIREHSNCLWRAIEGLRLLYNPLTSLQVAANK